MPTVHQYDDGVLSLVSFGVFGLLVCVESDITEDEIEELVNKRWPTGVVGLRWAVEADCPPVVCADDPNKTHYTLRC